ncbi:acyl-CoA dehydrogenase [Terribacillus saccharophilus]|nr:acyl-CoA dehydrogenase [Terribacillus saccharophilus]
MFMRETAEKTKVFDQVIQKAKILSEKFKQRAAHIDSSGEFPYENFQTLKESDFLSLTVPTEYGGTGLNLVEYLHVQEILAQGDAPTALSFGWQLGVVLENAENKKWNEQSFKNLSNKIIHDKILLNLVQTENATGSPSRGAAPRTTAILEGSKWRINGRKSFASMAAALDYSIATATILPSGNKGFFLIDHSLEGVSVVETWDSIAMRGTRSDDLILEDVIVDQDTLLIEENKGTSTPRGWYLQIAAVYLGIAVAARDYTIQFASEFQPVSLPGPIKDVPEVRRKIGEIELALFNAREVLYATARKWVEYPEKRSEMSPDLAAAKHIVTNKANEVVDLCMRIVGARSLSADNPLQRHFRDVRAGLHNPPTDDAVVYSLADAVFRQ